MRRNLAIAFIVSLTVWSLTAATRNRSQLKLPGRLEQYRSWSQLVKVPYQVPLELYIRCVLPRPKDWNEARKKYGPHTRKFIRVYGNDLAVKAFHEKSELPVGSIIAKEKFVGIPQGSSDGVAFMVKHAVSEFPESDGWEFLYFPAPAEERSVTSCAACHRTAKSTDYVFGRYPRDE